MEHRWRPQLITSGIPQATQRNKIAWHPRHIKRLLRYDFYHTGIYQIRWDGETYDIPIPPIIDSETAAKVKARRERYKSYPAGNLKADTLAAGLVYCEACNVKMHVKTLRYNEKVYYTFRCNNESLAIHGPDCAKKLSVRQLDADLWGKLWELISVPGKLEAAIETRVAELQAQEFDASAECEKLRKRLDDLAFERQKVVTWARKGTISDEDLGTQLAALTFEKASIRRELNDKALLVGNRAEQLMAVAQAYREGVTGGAIDVTKASESEAEAARQWQFKKTMVQGLVTRVDVRADKSIHVTVDLDFGKALPADSNIRVNPSSRASPARHHAA